jgi:hypothetical protein
MLIRRLFGVAALGAGLICVDPISMANAALITYAFDPGTSFVFPDGGAGDLTGTFTINEIEGNFTGDNVVVTGGIEAGTYTSSGSGEIFFEDLVALSYGLVDSVEVAGLGVQLHTVAGGPPAPGEPPPDLRALVLYSVTWQAMGGLGPRDAFDVTGGATLVPEPSTWAMMLLGFMGLGFAGYRSTRRSAIVGRGA